MPSHIEGSSLLHPFHLPLPLLPLVQPQPPSPAPEQTVLPAALPVDEDVFQSAKLESEMDLDFAGLDLEEPHQAGGIHAITMPTKKVAPPPPKRSQASAAATAAIAVRCEGMGGKGGRE